MSEAFIYGAVFLLLLSGVGCFFNQFSFQPTRLLLYISELNNWFTSLKLSLELKAVLLYSLLIGIPLLELMFFSDYIMRTYSKLVGIGILVLIPAAAMFVLSLINWGRKKFRHSPGNNYACVFSVAVYFGFAFSVLYMADPFSYLPFSWISLTANLIPMICLSYYLKSSPGSHLAALLVHQVNDGAGSSPVPIGSVENSLDAATQSSTPRLTITPSKVTEVLTKTSLTSQVVSGLAALVILVMYAVSTKELAGEETNLGAVNAVAIVVLDAIVLTLQQQKAGVAVSPVVASVVMAVNRGLLLSCGLEWWFLGTVHAPLPSQ
jgi:hypothetical protein